MKSRIKKCKDCKNKFESESAIEVYCERCANADNFDDIETDLGLEIDDDARFGEGEL